MAARWYLIDIAIGILRSLLLKMLGAVAWDPMNPLAEPREFAVNLAANVFVLVAVLVGASVISPYAHTD